MRHATDFKKDGLRLCQEEFLTVLKANMQEPNAVRLIQANANLVMGEAYALASSYIVYHTVCLALVA